MGEFKNGRENCMLSRPQIMHCLYTVVVFFFCSIIHRAVNRLMLLQQTLLAESSLIMTIYKSYVNKVGKPNSNLFKGIGRLITPAFKCAQNNVNTHMNR